MRLPPIIFTGLALLVSSCQQMKFPWNQAGTGTYDTAGTGSTWGQQPAGTQWGQSASTAYPTQNQGWQQQPTQPTGGNQGWGNPGNSSFQQPPPQQTWGNQSSGGQTNTNWANDGGWSNTNNSQGNFNTNANSGGNGWNNSPNTQPSSGGGFSSGSGRSHTVGRGDTLTNIAKRYGTSVRRVMQVNNMTDPNRIQLGQRLALP